MAAVDTAKFQDIFFRYVVKTIYLLKSLQNISLRLKFSGIFYMINGGEPSKTDVYVN